MDSDKSPKDVVLPKMIALWDTKNAVVTVLGLDTQTQEQFARRDAQHECTQDRGPR